MTVKPIPRDKPVRYWLCRFCYDRQIACTLTIDRGHVSTHRVLSARPIALLPFLVFLALFVGSGIYFTQLGTPNAFYQLPTPVAVLPALLLAVALHKDKKSKAIDEIVRGMGHPNIITMCMIYLLAGAFSHVANETGGVAATVNIGLTLVPPSLLLPGIFIISAFIATAMGTSMGTIAAVAPAAAALAQAAEIDSGWVAGAVLSGAMFGDNLSFISDTTIAATRTQGCAMRDKFWENLRLALPAALLTLVMFFVLQQHPHSGFHTSDTQWLKVLPYLSILVLAAIGMNVFLVLLIGIVLAGGIGMLTLPDYSLITFCNNIYAGFSDMQEIFLLSLLVGALGQIIRAQGGLVVITQWIIKRISHADEHQQGSATQRAELAIGGLVALTNTSIANNTVAIVLSGDIAKEVAEEHHISAKRSASLLDIFSCISQGLLPWGAQILLLGTAFKLSPLVIMQHSLYVLLLAVVVLISLVISAKRHATE